VNYASAREHEGHEERKDTSIEENFGMEYHRVVLFLAAISAPALAPLDAAAQQSTTQAERPGGVFAPPEGLPPFRRVHITGENPGLQLRLEANGPIVADFNFWRVDWSPVGSGHVCYVTTGDGRGPDDLRLAITDNEALAQYVTYETMAKLVPDFADPPYEVVQGTFRSEGDAVEWKSEHCISEEYTVVATWHELTPGNFGGMQPGNGFFMNFIISMAAAGEITVNGVRLPGTVLPGPGRPPSYLAFAETWLKE
jgi:hypothetical protein